MIELPLQRSPERLAFIHYLRTGLRVPLEIFAIEPSPLEAKFNPYHDPTNGQFTFGPGDARVSSSPAMADGVYRPTDVGISLLHPIAIQEEESPRGIGSNSGRFYDPMTLEQLFPNLNNTQGWPIIAVVDNLLDLTGPASALTDSMSLDAIRGLYADIKAIDPTYHLDSFGFPATLDGQMRQIKDLRWDRASAMYRIQGDVRSLQVETLRYLQERTDDEYENALDHAKSGKLPSSLSKRVSIGNYVDRQVKESLRQILSGHKIILNLVSLYE